MFKANRTSRGKITGGFTLVEIIVSVTIFFVIFTGIASIYTVGIALETRTELGTSAEYIAQFLLEYFMAAGPHNILYKPGTPDPQGGIYKPMVPNLPPPEGGYKVLELNGATYEEIQDHIDEIYDYAANASNFPDNQPRFKMGELFISEVAPYGALFPNIFTIEGFDSLPAGLAGENADEKLLNLNNLFPATINFSETSDGSGIYRVIINSFPPFRIMESPDLNYQLVVTGTQLSVNIYEYNVTIIVNWRIKGNQQTYEVKGTTTYRR